MKMTFKLPIFILVSIAMLAVLSVAFYQPFRSIPLKTGFNLVTEKGPPGRPVLLSNGKVLFLSYRETTVFDPESRTFGPTERVASWDYQFLRNGNLRLNQYEVVVDYNADNIVMGPSNYNSVIALLLLQIERKKYPYRSNFLGGILAPHNDSVILLPNHKLLIFSYKSNQNTGIYDLLNHQYIKLRQNEQDFKLFTTLMSDGNLFIYNPRANNIEIFDTRKEAFVQGPVLQVKRQCDPSADPIYLPSLIALRDGRVVISGCNKHEIEIYNPKTQTIRVNGSLPSYSAISSILLKNDNILFLGGCNDCYYGDFRGMQNLKLIVRYDPLTGKTSSVGDLPAPAGPGTGPYSMNLPNGDVLLSEIYHLQQGINQPFIYIYVPNN